MESKDKDYRSLGHAYHKQNHRSFRPKRLRLLYENSAVGCAKYIYTTFCNGVSSLGNASHPRSHPQLGTLAPNVKEHVEKGSPLHTDAAVAYFGLPKILLLSADGNERIDAGGSQSRDETSR